MSEYILLHAISLKGTSWTFFNSAVVELVFKGTEFHTSGALFVRKRIKKLYLKIMSQTVIYSKITHIYNSLFRDKQYFDLHAKYFDLFHILRHTSLLHYPGKIFSE